MPIEQGPQPAKESALEIARGTYKKYEEIHRRFEDGDESVSEADVDATYQDYLRVHNEGAGKEGYHPYLPYEKSFSRRSEFERERWLSQLKRKREEGEAGKKK